MAVKMMYLANLSQKWICRRRIQLKLEVVQSPDWSQIRKSSICYAIILHNRKDVHYNVMMTVAKSTLAVTLTLVEKSEQERSLFDQ